MTESEKFDYESIQDRQSIRKFFGVYRGSGKRKHCFIF